MGPAFNSDGSLPPGIHWLDWPDFVARFGWNNHRLRLLAGLKRALDDLKLAGCQTVYVDGSFVTKTEIPGDFDACWEMAGVNLHLIGSTPLGNFRNSRAAQKTAYGGELFPSASLADQAGHRFLDFFQIDKNTGGPKGIVALNLRGIP